MRSKVLLLILLQLFFTSPAFTQNQPPRVFISPNLVKTSDEKIIGLLGEQFELVISSNEKKPMITSLTTENDSLFVTIQSETELTTQKFYFLSDDTIYPEFWIGVGTLTTLILLYFYRF